MSRAARAQDRPDQGCPDDQGKLLAVEDAAAGTAGETPQSEASVESATTETERASGSEVPAPAWPSGPSRGPLIPALPLPSSQATRQELVEDPPAKGWEAGVGVVDKAPETAGVVTSSSTSLREIFAAMDTNHDNAVNRREMILACRKDPRVREYLGLPGRFRQGSEEHTRFEEVFQRLDQDDSREITWEEFAGSMEEIRVREVAQAALETGLTPEAAKTVLATHVPECIGAKYPYRPECEVQEASTREVQEMTNQAAVAEVDVTALVERGLQGMMESPSQPLLPSAAPPDDTTFETRLCEACAAQDFPMATSLLFDAVYTHDRYAADDPVRQTPAPSFYRGLQVLVSMLLGADRKGTVGIRGRNGTTSRVPVVWLLTLAATALEGRTQEELAAAATKRNASSWPAIGAGLVAALETEAAAAASTANLRARLTELGIRVRLIEAGAEHDTPPGPSADSGMAGFSFSSGIPRLRISHTTDTEVLLEAPEALRARLAQGAYDGVVARIEDDAGSTVAALRADDMGAAVRLKAAEGPHWVALPPAEACRWALGEATLQLRVASTTEIETAWLSRAAA